jgi:hypothetical protein
MEAFLSAGVDAEMGATYAATGVSYDAHAAVDGALRYAAVDSNIGAELVRKLVKTVKMIADPDMEEYLARSTQKFCEHMFNLCELIKGIGEDGAMAGLKLIAVVRGLLFMGMVVSVDCPVVELFNVQHQRLVALVALVEGETDEMEWATMGEESHEGWVWHADLNEWIPEMKDNADSSDEEGEAAWLASVAASKYRMDHLGKVPAASLLNPNSRAPCRTGSGTA